MGEAVLDCQHWPRPALLRYCRSVSQTAGRKTPGAVYQRLRTRFGHAAWLNPMDERMWSAPSVRSIGRIFPMYPLTVEGVFKLAADLA